MNGTILKTTLAVAAAALMSGCIGRQIPPSRASGTAINEPSGAQPSTPGQWREGLEPSLSAVPTPSPENGNWMKGVGNNRYFGESAAAAQTSPTLAVPASQTPADQQTQDSDIMQP